MLSTSLVATARDLRASRQSEPALTAISRSQAIVELGPDGTILNASGSYLRMVGYSLSEVAGHPHAMLLDREQRESQEYLSLWEALRRGEFRAGTFRRIGKAGRDLRVEVCFSPVFDALGQLARVIELAVEPSARRGRPESASRLERPSAPPLPAALLSRGLGRPVAGHGHALGGAAPG